MYMDDNEEMIILLHTVPFFNIYSFIVVLHIFESFSSVKIALPDDRNQIAMPAKYDKLCVTNQIP